jgi:hypothetical protein
VSNVVWEFTVPPVDVLADFHGSLDNRRRKYADNLMI